MGWIICWLTLALHFYLVSCHDFLSCQEFCYLSSTDNCYLQQIPVECSIIFTEVIDFRLKKETSSGQMFEMIS